MTTSRPARRAGIESDWTSFGEVIFCRVSDARTRALTPASANVCNEAPRCLSFLLYLPRSTGSVLGQEERTRAGDARTRRSNVTRSERASIVCGYSRLARPDVGAADLAIDAGRALGRVNLEIDVCKACHRQRGSVVIDRDRARDASRPSVQRLLDLRVVPLERSMLRFARSSISSVMSTPYAWPPGDTRRAESNTSRPAPDPRSSTTWPGSSCASIVGLPQPRLTDSLSPIAE